MFFVGAVIGIATPPRITRPWDSAFASIGRREHSYSVIELPSPVSIFIKLLSNATILTYTDTEGSSYYDADVTKSTAMDGWLRVTDVVSDPAGGGMRGIAWHQPKTGRMLVAFRGTDLSIKGVSGASQLHCSFPVFSDDISGRSGRFLRKRDALQRQDTRTTAAILLTVQ